MGSKNVTLLCPFCGNQFEAQRPTPLTRLPEQSALFNHSCKKCGATFEGYVKMEPAQIILYKKFPPINIAECLLPSIKTLDDFVALDFIEILKTATEDIFAKGVADIPFTKCRTHVGMLSGSLAETRLAYYCFFGFVRIDKTSCSIITSSEGSRFNRWMAHELEIPNNYSFTTTIKTIYDTLIFDDKNEARFFLEFSNERDKKVAAFAAEAFARAESMYYTLRNSNDAVAAWGNLLNLLPANIFIAPESYRNYLLSISKDDGIIKEYLRSIGIDLGDTDTKEKPSTELDIAEKAMADFESLICDKFYIPDFLCHTVTCLMLFDAALNKLSKQWEIEYKSSIDNCDYESYVSECVKKDILTIPSVLTVSVGTLGIFYSPVFSAA